MEGPHAEELKFSSQQPWDNHLQQVPTAVKSKDQYKLADILKTATQTANPDGLGQPCSPVWSGAAASTAMFRAYQAFPHEQLNNSDLPG